MTGHQALMERDQAGERREQTPSALNFQSANDNHNFEFVQVSQELDPRSDPDRRDPALFNSSDDVEIRKRGRPSTLPWYKKRRIVRKAVTRVIADPVVTAMMDGAEHAGVINAPLNTFVTLRPANIDRIPPEKRSTYWQAELNRIRSFVRHHGGELTCIWSRESRVGDGTGEHLHVLMNLRRGLMLKGAPWTFDVAVTNYLTEHLGGDADDTTLSSLAWLQKRLGHQRLIDIDDSVIAGLVAERALDIVPNKKTPTRVSNSTVNRTVTEPLRRVLRRALSVHKQPAGDITWSSHLKKEPPERVRELKDFEEVKLFAAIPEDYHPIIRFHLLSGVRLAESVSLTWNDIDFGNRLIMINGKGGTRESIPMPPSIREVLFPLQGHDPHYVFTYIVKKSQFNPNTRKPYVRGERLPVAYSGLKTCFRRARKKAGITDFRFHDQRHTAATRALRVSNLKVVQKLLRHRDIATTTRYAHVDNDDIMAAMEKAAQKAFAVSPTNSPTEEHVEMKIEAITKG